ncbi:helix-turn-helix domain-containing protein [Methylobacterium sp. J-001]|uniref:helix-turn-helix domain-containing protein n=1 Tax=Methylobacterium sp. J-001 TaxID=2836609 RepID=UPI001FB8E74C|nr:helix-turn-helix domain-containing protein [Methylobacterium sp. J-001]MCJ2115150.1 helix-turn-helix domain-containing protein [Methylobacterium sp. J-001]
MLPETAIRQKPGRKSTIATHPQREAIEAACAAGISLRRVAIRFNVGIMAVHRYWNGLAFEYRMALSAAVSNLDDTRWREVATGLAAIARRHPDARADLDALVQRISMPIAASDIGDRAHAA